MQTLEVKKNGKVEHADGCHDDQIFSYLAALYVFYEGQNLMENFGIQKTMISTDEDVEIEEGTIESEEGGFEKVDIETAQRIDDGIDDELGINRGLYESVNGIILQTDFNVKEYEKEQAQFNILLANNKPAREAYEKKYSKEPGTSVIVNSLGYIKLPDEIFGAVSADSYLYDEAKKELELHGNLYNEFMKLKL